MKEIRSINLILVQYTWVATTDVLGLAGGVWHLARAADTPDAALKKLMDGVADLGEV